MDRPASDPDARLLFGAFSFLLALSLILHRVWWDGFEVDGLHFLVVLSAFWVLLRPASLTRFLSMVGVAVASVAVDMPSVGDHTLLVGVVGVCVLVSAAVATVRSRRLPDPGALFARTAPFLRASVVVVYAAAALAKLNGTFFDPALSCASVMTERLAWFDPSLLSGSWPVVPAIWSTVAIEASLPVLLAIPRTRSAGLTLGIGFHLVLALAGNVPFTAVILAFYVAFLPADLPGRVRLALAPLRGPRAARPLGVIAAERRWVEPVAYFALVGCWVLGARLGSAEPQFAEALIDNGARAVVVVLVLVAVTVAILLRRLRPSTGVAARAPGSLRFTGPVFSLGIVLLVLNAAAPYLGLKTSTSFNMFSNLRTEPGYWNHAFLPEAVRIFDHGNELVRVVSSNDRWLRDQGADGYLLARFELDRYLREHSGTEATYATAESARQAGSPSPGPLIDDIARFQPVPPPGRPGC